MGKIETQKKQWKRPSIISKLSIKQTLGKGAKGGDSYEYESPGPGGS